MRIEETTQYLNRALKRYRRACKRYDAEDAWAVIEDLEYNGFSDEWEDLVRDFMNHFPLDDPYEDYRRTEMNALKINFPWLKK